MNPRTPNRNETKASFDREDQRQDDTWRLNTGRERSLNPIKRCYFLDRFSTTCTNPCRNLVVFQCLSLSTSSFCLSYLPLSSSLFYSTRVRASTSRKEEEEEEEGKKKQTTKKKRGSSNQASSRMRTITPGESVLPVSLRICR